MPAGTDEAPLIHATIDEIELTFVAAPGLFSPRQVDAGTLSMLSHVRFTEQDKVLDLGCGYGAAGIYAAKHIDPSRVYLLDNDPRALALAEANAERNDVGGMHVVLSDAFDAFREAGFTLILCNPPYHSDFSVAKRFIHKGFNRLKVGGKLWMVTQREPWYRNKLRAIFGDVKLHRHPPYRLRGDQTFSALRPCEALRSHGEERLSPGYEASARATPPEPRRES
ncbi:MAG: methyltransferase [Gammaproteobacteria bacterium]